MAIKLTTPMKLKTGVKVDELKSYDTLIIDSITLRVREQKMVVEYRIVGADNEQRTGGAVTFPISVATKLKATLKDCYDEIVKLSGFAGNVSED